MNGAAAAGRPPHAALGRPQQLGQQRQGDWLPSDSLAGAVECALDAVPVYEAAHVGAHSAKRVLLALLVAVDSHLRCRPAQSLKRGGRWRQSHALLEATGRVCRTTAPQQRTPAGQPEASGRASRLKAGARALCRPRCTMAPVPGSISYDSVTCVGGLLEWRMSADRLAGLVPAGLLLGLPGSTTASRGPTLGSTRSMKAAVVTAPSSATSSSDLAGGAREGLYTSAHSFGRPAHTAGGAGGRHAAGVAGTVAQLARPLLPGRAAGAAVSARQLPLAGRPTQDQVGDDDAANRAARHALQAGRRGGTRGVLQQTGRRMRWRRHWRRLSLACVCVHRESSACCACCVACCACCACHGCSPTCPLSPVMM